MFYEFNANNQNLILKYQTLYTHIKIFEIVYKLNFEHPLRHLKGSTWIKVVTLEKKGYHLLIEAFMAIADPELCLSLYGYGEERSRLSEMAKSDKRIEINDGPRSVKEAVPLFRDADLFVLPCTMDRKGDTDGLPTVLMEAMAAGVPVLTTPIASIPDLVTDGKTGFLVESGSVESLLSGLHNTLQTTKDFREYIATSAMEHLDLHFAPISNTKAIVNDWRSLLNLRDEHVNLSILG